MCCGDDLLGESLCGEDTAPVVEDVDVELQGARLFDGTTRDLPLDDNGHFKTIHPVDSAVQMALLLEAEKISATPEVGQTFRAIVLGSRVKSDVDNRVRAALAHLTSDKRIEILAIQYEQPNRHALFIAVDYLNLRTMSEETAFAAARRK